MLRNAHQRHFRFAFRFPLSIDFPSNYSFHVRKIEAQTVLMAFVDVLQVCGIVEFKDDQWNQIGYLSKGRYYHSSLSVADQTIIVGGYAPGG